MARQGRVQKVRYTLWARNSKGPRHWLPLFRGLSEQVALEEMIERQDRVRRTGHPCRFQVKPDGERPDVE